jgi:hypothetical protein
MWKWLSDLIDSLRSVPLCPRCGLMGCEAVSTECACAFAMTALREQCDTAAGCEDLK